MQSNTFERFEEKYLMTQVQYQAMMAGLRGKMQPDMFGRSTVSSIYYDTQDYRLIRSSLDKPDYKEKLRVRAYGTPTAESKAFVELKKKVDGIAYNVPGKAQVILTEGKKQWFNGELPVTQFGTIEYLAPALFNKKSTVQVTFNPDTGGLIKVDREEGE